MAASMTKAERAELAEAEARLKKWRLQKLAAMDNPALLMKKAKTEAAATPAARSSRHHAPPSPLLFLLTSLLC